MAISEGTSVGIRLTVEGGAPLMVDDQATIGREADVQVIHDLVSAEHAVVRLDDGAWLFEDPGSPTGSYVHGRLVRRLSITERVSVRLGHPITGPELVIEPPGEVPGARPDPADVSLLDTNEFAVLDATAGPSRASSVDMDGVTSQALATREGTVALEGIARQVSPRMQQGVSRIPGRTVIAFRLERYDDAGNRLDPVPVEIGTFFLRGQISDGERVLVEGRWSEGTVLASRVVNKATGANVGTPKTAKKWIRRVLIGLGVLGLIWVAWMIFIGSMILEGFMEMPEPGQFDNVDSFEPGSPEDPEAGTLDDGNGSGFGSGDFGSGSDRIKIPKGFGKGSGLKGFGKFGDPESLTENLPEWAEDMQEEMQSDVPGFGD